MKVSKNKGKVSHDTESGDSADKTEMAFRVTLGTTTIVYVTCLSHSIFTEYNCFKALWWWYAAASLANSLKTELMVELLCKSFLC